jgi:uncharacterized membrane protein
MHIQQAWQAPMPPPAGLGHYDAVLPGAAERIVRMAEQSLQHQIDQDAKLNDAEVTTAKRGQTMAFSLAGAAVALATLFFLLGNVVAGLAFLGMPILLLVRSFLKRNNAA